ncbi:restriction endonuclease subunit S [Ruegeria pomeroyi]|nr:restriction endonuclease subunit S [Ruegeria pomeroyi]
MPNQAPWPFVRLGDYCNVVRGGSPRPAGDPRFFGGSFVPWLTVAAITNVSSSKMIITDAVGFLTEEGSRKSRRFFPGTVVIANSGWKCGVAKILGFECCGNDGIAALKDLHSFDPKFICYWLNSQTENLRSKAAAGNEQPNLNTDRIAAIQVPAPPLKEQQAIAEALLDLDSAITEIDFLIAKKYDLRAGVMHRLVTGESRLLGFSTPWQKKSLGDLGVFHKGAGVKRDDALSGHLPCVRYGEIYTTHHNVIRQFSSYISRSVADGARRIQFGDLLFAGSGETKAEIGKCVALAQDVEAYAGGDIIILRPKSGNPVFLGWLMNTPQVVRQKANFGQGDAVVHISASALASIEVSLPDLDEQDAIARVITDMDAEITALEARLEKTRALKQGMMQALLTGRVRLPVQGEALDALEVAHA